MKRRAALAWEFPVLVEAHTAAHVAAVLAATASAIRLHPAVQAPASQEAAGLAEEEAEAAVLVAVVALVAAADDTDSKNTFSNTKSQPDDDSV